MGRYFSGFVFDCSLGRGITLASFQMVGQQLSSMHDWKMDINSWDNSAAHLRSVCGLILVLSSDLGVFFVFKFWRISFALVSQI